MNQEEMEKESVDLKLIWTLIVRSIPVLIAAMAVAAFISCAVYSIYYHYQKAGRRYEAVSKYYITFSESMDKSYLDYYYNGYTWGDLVSSDPILGYAMQILPDGYDRRTVDGLIETEILSDVRLLTTTVRAKEPELVTEIQAALEEAVVRYGGIGENLEKIEVIRSDDPILETIPDHRWKFVLIWSVLAFVFALFGELAGIAVRGVIYLPGQVSRRYGIPAAGVRLKKKALKPGQSEKMSGRYTEYEDQCNQELTQNLNYLTKGKEYPTVVVNYPGGYTEKEFARFREAGGVIIEFPQSKTSYRDMDKLTDTLKIQDCPVICAVMTQGDRSLLSRYQKG